MPGTLYLVSTPIGNLEDITLRAVRILTEVDFVACEDTRVTRKLMNHLSLRKELLSYYRQKERSQGEVILARLLAGESCALVSDAGTPCISDPGVLLVSLCREAGVPVVPIPGPSAVITALSASGLMGRFCFEGFLSVTKKSRNEHLDSLRQETRTIIFYEAPHKLRATLLDLLRVLGDRRIVLARELTKLHEELIDTTLAEAVALYEELAPRGEYVLLLEGAPSVAQEEGVSFEAAVERIDALTAKGMSTADAVRQVARETGHPRNALYRAMT